MGQHSLRDLCGVLSHPRWDDANHGIQAVFTPFGPGKDVALAVATDVLEHPELAEHVGFSADFYFEMDSVGAVREPPEVKSILSANSADVVIKPAAGGKWLRVLNQIHQENTMPEQPDSLLPPETALSEAEANLARLQAGAQAVMESQKAQKALEELEERNQAALRLRQGGSWKGRGP